MRVFRVLLLTSCCLVPLSAHAQTGSAASPISTTPPAFQSVDSQGVDLASGNLHLDVPFLNIGREDSSLGWSYKVRGNITADNMVPMLSDNIAAVEGENIYSAYVKVMGTTIAFSFDRYVNGTDASDGVVMKPKYKKFGQLIRYTTPAVTRTFKTKSGTTTFSSTIKYVYTDHDGARYTFFYFPSLPNGDLVDNIEFPNGNIERYYYDYLNGENAGNDIKNTVISVENSFGMQLRNLSPHAYVDRSGYRDSTVTTVALNKAHAYCAPGSYACSVGSEWSRISIYDKYVINSSPTSYNNYSTETIQISDVLNNKYTFNYTGLGATEHVISYSAPNSSGVFTKTVNYNTNENGYYSTVSAINYPDPATGANLAHSYSYAVSAGSVTTTSVDPLNRSNVTSLNLTSGLPSTVTDKLGRTLTYTYDADGNISSAASQDGSVTSYTYDSRGNPLSVTKSPRTGSDLASITAYYGYDAECANPVKCNKPNWTKDPTGNETDYTYTSEGFVESVTGPAATAGGVRPQVRYYYSKLQAYLMNASGTVTASGQPITLLSRTSQCLTQAGATVTGTPGQGPFALSGEAACAGTSDEQVNSIDYGPQQAGTPNNLWPVRRTMQSGDGGIVSSVSYAYDKVGNIVAEEGPLPGAADTSVFTYNAARQLTGVIGPDPDGADPRKNGALRYVYGNDGRVLQTLLGVVDNSSDTSFSSFDAIQELHTDYDVLGRTIRSRLIGDGVVFGVAQYSYDAGDRLYCMAVRMNTGLWNALPQSACTLTPGAPGEDGPDRITYTEYDRADRVIKVTSGYGVSPQVDKEVVAYTDNSLEQVVADGKGNRTTYEYDGFDRLKKVRYPNAACCDSSTADFEEYGYDANGNRTSWRRRFEPSPVIFTYDALNRITRGLRGEVYGYDNFGHRTSATFAGGAASATYDALGRMTSETTNSKTLSYQYDLSGRRTRITWPDTLGVGYEYDVSGAVKAVNEYATPTSAAVSLATYAYDDLGRPTTVTRGASGPTTYYAYDAASRLACLSHGVVCTDPAPTWKFNYTAAGQIKQRVARSALYEWPGSPGNRTYGINGLNQITSVVSAATDTVNYDLRGNLSMQGGVTYGYDLLNNLTSTASGGVPQATLAYEPTGRLWQVTASGATTNFLYSGSDLVAEYVNGAISRRYVPGPGTDAPLVWYEGAGFADRRYLLADPQGSIVSVNSATGAAIATNTYDEYGIPGGDNVGRFRYTGQIWLPEVGLYHYKARAYSPTLGRFLQTDPIGYGDGMNWYAYVHNDPVNMADPTGTDYSYSIPGGTRYCSSAATDKDQTGVYTPAGDCYNDYSSLISELDFFDQSQYGQLFGGNSLGGNSPQNTCGSDPGINGIGVSAGVQLDAGLGKRGTVQSESLGLGLFGNGGGPGSLTAGAFRTSIDSTFSPSTAGTNQAFGAVAQGGVSIFATNAHSVRELSGPFNTISGAIGIGAGASFQYSYGGGIWQLSVGFTPLPGAVLGIGGSRTTSNTNVTPVGCWSK